MFVRVERFPVGLSLFEPFSHFGREIDEMFDEIWRPSVRSGYTYPHVDVAEYEKESVVVAELPGVRKEDLKITVQDGVLTISGVRQAPQLPEGSNWLRSESGTGEFSRTIELPHDVKVESISAELTNGVLRLVLPKSDEVRPREIAIQ